MSECECNTKLQYLVVGGGGAVLYRNMELDLRKCSS